MKHIHQFVLFGLLVGGLGLSCKTAAESPVIPPVLVPITPPITDTSVPEVVSAKIVDDSGVIRIDQTTRLISIELSNKYAQELVDISYSLTRNTYFSRRRSDILLQRLCSIGTATVEVKNTLSQKNNFLFGGS